MVIPTGPVVESLYEMGASDVFSSTSSKSGAWACFPWKGSQLSLRGASKRRAACSPSRSTIGAGGLGEAFGSLLVDHRSQTESDAVSLRRGLPLGALRQSALARRKNAGLRGAKLPAPRIEEWVLCA